MTPTTVDATPLRLDQTADSETSTVTRPRSGEREDHANVPAELPVPVCVDPSPRPAASHRRASVAEESHPRPVPPSCEAKVPVSWRGVTAASNALSSANMALADYDDLVPLDQVIGAMREVGNMMPRELCCTGLGGLAVTQASKEIEEKLNGINN